MGGMSLLFESDQMQRHTKLPLGNLWVGYQHSRKKIEDPFGLTHNILLETLLLHYYQGDIFCLLNQLFQQ